MHPEPGLSVITRQTARARQRPQQPTTLFRSSNFLSFFRLCLNIPPYLHHIRSGIRHHDWGVPELDTLADALSRYEDRFSGDKTDLGHGTALPLRIELKPGARPIKQRPYRRNPAINAKVHINIDKFLAAGVMCKSNSRWASPLVVVMRKDGNIRLTCN